MIFSLFIIIMIRNGAFLIIFSLTDSEAAVRTALHVAPSFGHKFDSPMPPVFLAGKLASKTLVTTCVCEANSLNQRQVRSLNLTVMLNSPTAQLHLEFFSRRCH